MGKTYRDGMGAARCCECGTELHTVDGHMRALVRVDDCEELACLLVDYIDCPEVWEGVVERLGQTVGKSVAQMREARRLHDQEVHRG